MLRQAGSSRAELGFTVVELLMVIVVMGFLTSIAYPRWTSVRASTNLRAARVQFPASLAIARAAAVRFGRPAQLKRTGNTIQVRADTGGTGVFVALTSPIALDSQFSVTLNASVD